MFCILTHRRLKPGTFDQFRSAWERDRSVLPAQMRAERAYHARSLENENEIISFHITNLALEELMELRAVVAKAEKERERAMSEYVEWTGLSGVFQVIEEVSLSD